MVPTAQPVGDVDFCRHFLRFYGAAALSRWPLAVSYHLLAVISVSECWDIVAERGQDGYERGRRPLGRLRGLTGCWIMDSMESLNKTVCYIILYNTINSMHLHI